MRTLTLTTVAALAVAAAACSPSGTDNQLSTDADLANDAAVGNVLGEANAADPALPTDAAGFVAAVAASDLYEIESSALAASKAASSEVKETAGHLSADHKKSTADLKAAAGPANITVEPRLDAEKQALIDQLEAASGAEFDRLWVEQQKTAHQKALALLQGYRDRGDNEALKAFANQAVPIVQGHLDHLNALKP